MKKRLLSIFATITAACLLVAGFATTAIAGETEETTEHVGGYSVLLPKGVILPAGAGESTSVTAVAATDDTWGAASTTTWYVVTGTKAISNPVTVSGNVNLILCDNASLTVTATQDNYAGIVVSGDGNSLTIYAGSTSNTVEGNGILNAISGKAGAGIGGNQNADGGNITINGGVITATATGGDYAAGAGIGGGESGKGSNIIINGGIVTASGNVEAAGAGIGGGWEGTASNIIINGGTVTASSIHGAGIGSGFNDSIGASDITINGGYVTADSVNGASLGWAELAANSGNITVSGDLIIKADNNNPPTTIITHATGVDLSDDFYNAKHAIIKSAAAKVLETGEQFATVQDAINAAVIGVSGIENAKTVMMIDDSTENVSVASDTYVILDLNGYTLKASGKNTSKNSVITNNGTLTVTDSSAAKTGTITGGTGIENDGAYFGGGVTNAEGATFTLSGGTISGNTAANGSGGGVCNDGIFIMDGGAISGNSSEIGGGVYNMGTFTLNDGTIANNTAVGGEDSRGGGVGNSNIFTMNGGTISGNTTETGGMGGGVYNGAGTFTMSDGTISGNTASLSGGVHNEHIFNMSGGTISGNTATGYIDSGITYYGGGLFSIGTTTVSGAAKITGNTTAAAAANNISLFSGGAITIGTSGLTSGASIGITLATGFGKFTSNGASTDKQYFFSDDPRYIVAFDEGTGSGGYLKLVNVPKLYFGQNATKSYEYSLFTDAARTKNYYSGFGTTWSVEWSAADNKPQLNLNNFNSSGAQVQIDCDCIINATGTNSISSTYANGLVVNQNTIFRGTGTLNVSSSQDDAMVVNAIATINGATVTCSVASSEKKDITFSASGKVKLISGDIQDKSGASFYPSTLTTLYLTKTNAKAYALYTDYETCNFEYAVEASGAEELSGSDHYAALILSGALNKTVVFKQDTAQTYAAVLRVTGTDAKLGGFDASDGTLTVQSENGKKVTISGDIKAQKLYLVQCNGLTMEIVDGNIIAAEKQGVGNELMIGSNSDANKVTLTIKNGGIQFEKGAITIVNADVTIGKNTAQSAAAVGINAHRINLNGSKLTVNDVTTGIKLYEPTQYGEGAVLTVGNKSTLNISAAGVGVQGTFGQGGNYYNNITVLDTDSTITVAGITKAAASVSISPIPSGKIVRSTDNRAVFFKINDDANFTTDYCYAGTTNAAKSLTLADITVYVNSEIENGKVSVSDSGAAAGETITVTTTPNDGYELDKIIVKDKDGIDITSTALNGTTITMPAAGKQPITVSATFKVKVSPTPEPEPEPTPTPEPTPVPSTGDTAPMAIAALTALAAVAIGAVALIVRKRARFF